MTYHSREPFTGARRVFAAIGKGVKEVANDSTHMALSSGDRMPQVGLGLWKMPQDVCADQVFNSIKHGYRLLDSAADYGNEVMTGQGIKRALDEGVCKREDLFVVSKLWNTFHRPENVKLACKKTLTDMGVDYLDLYLIHFPIALQFVPIESKYPPEWVNFDKKVNGGKDRMVLDTGVSYQQTW